MNIFEKEIFNMYEEINIGKSEICRQCRSTTYDLCKPVSIWQVGDNYYDSQYRLLFVGKVARGEPGKQYNDFMDSTERADVLYNKKGWAYWNYTKAIASALYGENSWEKVAFTNMVKCNNSTTVDKTNEFTKNCCLHIVKKEIDILKPKHIIFYTKNAYDEQIEEIFDSILNSKKDDVRIGKKIMNKWTFTGLINKNEIKVIRVGHPERMKKSDYINEIINYIKEL